VALTIVRAQEQTAGKSRRRFYFKGRKRMAKEPSHAHPAHAHHLKAAEHHEQAVKHHKEAAGHYAAGHHETAADHAHTAHAHMLHATHHAGEAAKAHVSHGQKKS
jgi:hypothetical protein